MAEKLHLRDKHPMNLLKQLIVNHFNKKHVNRRGNPIFSVYDQLTPVVTTEQASIISANDGLYYKEWRRRYFALISKLNNFTKVKYFNYACINMTCIGCLFYA